MRKNEINEGRKQYYHSLKLVNLRREKKNLIGSRPHQLTLSFNFFLDDGCPNFAAGRKQPTHKKFCNKLKAIIVGVGVWFSYYFSLF